MSLKTLNAGTRSLLALGFIGLIGLGLVAALRVDERPSDMGSQDQVAIQTLAETPIGPEDFGSAQPLERVSLTLKRGETLSGVMERAGVAGRESDLALLSLTQDGLLDARRVQAGLGVTAYTDQGGLYAVAVEAEPGRRYLTTRNPSGGFIAMTLDSRLIPQPMLVQGTIETSLYEDARKLGAGDQQVVDFAQVFAYDLDFQRDVHPGDAFEIIFDVMKDERGEVIRRGEVLYAALNGKVVNKGFYRFTTPDDGISDYFQANGESSTKFLMKTPINGARLSSRFGTRRHPISGYTRLHKGTDFAAPTGTPIYAAGHGVVERASRYGGYGHYVRIKHENGYKTAYAHLSRYGRGIKSGTRVRQGQVIGYVGSTGASTGPHLHYEVYRNGKAIDVMRLNLPTGRKLAETPEIMAEFELRRNEIDALRNGSDAPLTLSAMPQIR